MQKSVYLQAPAKVNLHLDILDKRADGYHDLISIFQLISLYDKIYIRSLKTKNTYNLIGDFTFPVQENLITRAVNSFRKLTGINSGITIEVKKQIPQGGGLGGGSSDAASVLIGLNALFQTGMDTFQLKGLGAELGCDVTFFIEDVCAIVSGVGEIIKPIKARNDFFILLIYPGFEINTAKAYQWLDSNRFYTIKTSDDPGYLESEYSRIPDKKKETEFFPMATEQQLEAIYGESALYKWNFCNSFRDILFKKFDEYKTIYRILIDSGASYANISGSGSTIFGIFKEKKKLESAFKLFKGKYSFIRIAKPLDKRPLFILQ